VNDSSDVASCVKVGNISASKKVIVLGGQPLELGNVSSNSFKIFTINYKVSKDLKKLYTSMRVECKNRDRRCVDFKIEL
jgi:hypothetical protein